MKSFFKDLFTQFLIGPVLSLSSFSGVVYFYILVRQDFPGLSLKLPDTNEFILRNLLYLLIFGLFAYGSLRLTRALYEKNEALDIIEEKPIESIAVPTYIGFFVIAIEMQQLDPGVSFIVLVVIFLFWTRLEKVFYFNPIWLLFGYRFYEVKSSSKDTVTLITKRSKLKGSHKLTGLRRLNNYTFMEK